MGHLAAFILRVIASAVAEQNVPLRPMRILLDAADAYEAAVSPLREVPAVLLAVTLAAVAPAVAAGCTPGERATAGAAVSTLGPALCSALVGIGADGRAGLVCADAAKVLGAALTLARADARPTMTEASGPVGATCEPIMLADVVPGRDPREFVCRGALDEAAIRKAFSVGHAR